MPGLETGHNLLAGGRARASNKGSSAAADARRVHKMSIPWPRSRPEASKPGHARLRFPGGELGPMTKQYTIAGFRSAA
jgi:hypothetical protein